MAPLPLPFPASNLPAWRTHWVLPLYAAHPSTGTSVVAASTYALSRKSYCLHYINTYSTQHVKNGFETHKCTVTASTTVTVNGFETPL